MKIFINNANGTLWLSLNLLRWVGFLVPDNFEGRKKKLLPFYSFFWFMFIVGIYVIVQTGDLIQVWGDITLMTGTSFLLFTNMAFITKIINVMVRRDAVLAIIDEGDEVLRSERRIEGKAIVKSSNQETSRLLYLYGLLTVVTVFGWAASAEKGSLPLRAWYPYDTSKSPAYELTYLHQSVAVILLAFLNVSLDVLVTSLAAVCRCRFQLLALSLRTLCHDIPIDEKHLVSPEHKQIVHERLRLCILQHQSILESAAKIKTCFSGHILAQFTVSIVIICVTAYTLALETHDNPIRLIAMFSYLLGMMMQVFLYCYQGDYLSEESSDIADAAYECPWYACPIPLRRSLLVIMARSRRVAILTAGGFSTLSLACFVSIIKASYSFFTVLQQVEE
uniref:Odorant receptor n=1 Tax=Manduca sexta TaxID=7130 RepID=A0A0P1IVK0_MANSE|nr:Olfactory receptor 34 [Manduca sexta]